MKQYFYGHTHLFALVVDMNLERRVFLLETIEGSGEVGSFEALWLEGERDDRVGNEHRSLQNG